MSIMGHQLRALGHQCDWIPGSHDFMEAHDKNGDHINVLIEGFTPASIADIARAHSLGARFLCVATEEPTEKGFNHGTQKEMVARQKMFPEAAKFFDGILHLVPGEATTKWYGQYAPTAYAELGYAPSLVVSPDIIRPTYDVGFYGSLSPRRLKILKRLARWLGTEKAVRIVPDFCEQAERNNIMRQARVIVQLRKFEPMGLVSSSRCAMTVQLIGRPIVAEPHLLSEPWDSIVHFSSSIEQFYTDVVAVRAAWRGVHASQLAKLKEKLSPQKCVGDALKKIGIFEKVAA